MTAYPLLSEPGLAAAGFASYLFAALIAWSGAVKDWRADRWVVRGLALGVALFAAAIGLRWTQTGYGPFLTLYEVLLSNLFSLGTIYLLAYWRFPAVRPGALLVLPIFVLLAFWALNSSAEPGRLPATYRSGWLWVHVGVGKVFLGTCLVAVGLAGVALLRRLARGSGLTGVPDGAALDPHIWRFLTVAFVFHTFMLIAGAVWAQDAWGHYWTWDSLETWAFLTWLAMGLVLHARLTWPLPPWSGWVAVLGIFALAFVTFFGVPFSGLGPHKGVIL